MQLFSYIVKKIKIMKIIVDDTLDYGIIVLRYITDGLDTNKSSLESAL